MLKSKALPNGILEVAPFLGYHYMQNLLNIFCSSFWISLHDFNPSFSSNDIEWDLPGSLLMKFTPSRWRPNYSLHHSACSILVANILSLRSCWRFISEIVFPLSSNLLLGEIFSMILYKLLFSHFNFSMSTVTLANFVCVWLNNVGVSL